MQYLTWTNFNQEKWEGTVATTRSAHLKTPLTFHMSH